MANMRGRVALDRLGWAVKIAHHQSGAFFLVIVVSA